MAAYRTEQSIVAPNQKIKSKTPKKNGSGAFVSKSLPSSLSSSENFEIYGGILYPPSLSLPVFNNHHYRQNQQQPPLLPLPIPAIQQIQQQPLRSLSLGQGLSLSNAPIPRRNRIRDASLTPKKSKQAKREEVKRDLKSASRSISELLNVSSGNRLGPDPNDLPKEIQLPVVITADASRNFDAFSVFNLSPPPSSLPLPKFSLMRPKFACNAEAAGVDTGATDNLRRILRLR